MKKTLASKVDKKEILKDKEGRVLVVPITTLVRGQRMWIVNIYAPASQEENSIHALYQELHKEEQKKMQAHNGQK